MLTASARLVFAHGRYTMKSTLFVWPWWAANDTGASTAAPNHGRYIMKSTFFAQSWWATNDIAASTEANHNQTKARTPPKITRGQQYGGGGTNRLFITGCYGNENALLLVGPTVHASLINVLLLFRKYRVALTTDVSQMYTAVLLPEHQRDLHRFVWRKDSTHMGAETGPAGNAAAGPM